MDWPQALGALELSSLSLLGPRYSTLETSLLVLERRLAGNNATRPTSAGGPLHKLHALLALCPPPSSLAGEQRHQHARGSKGCLGGPVFLFQPNRVDAWLVSLGRRTTCGRCLSCTPEWEPCPHLDICHSHASVVQPPTSWWSESACPVCTSLDQWHMGQACQLALFSGAGEGRGKKRRGQQAAVLAGEQWAGAQANPYQALWR